MQNNMNPVYGHLCEDACVVRRVNGLSVMPLIFPELVHVTIMKDQDINSVHVTIMKDQDINSVHGFTYNFPNSLNNESQKARNLYEWIYKWI